jgi:hypothetical protein
MSNSKSLLSPDGPNSELSAKVEAQGGLVRQLKGDKKPKEEVDVAVKQLLALKVRIIRIAFNILTC